LLSYLDTILFDEKKRSVISNNRQTGDEILKLYYKFAPHRLSTLLLESSLKCYTKSYAISLLDKPQNGHEEEEDTEEGNDLVSGWSESSPKDKFVLGLLLLETGNVSKAAKAFTSIEPSCLVEFCVSYPKLFAYDIAKAEKHKTTQQAKEKPKKEPPKQEIKDETVSLLTKALEDTTEQPTKIEKDVEENGEFSDEIEDSNSEISKEINQKEKDTLSAPKNGDCSGNCIPSLGTLLRDHTPWVLLELLVQLKDTIPVECALDLLEPTAFKPPNR